VGFSPDGQTILAVPNPGPAQIWSGLLVPIDGEVNRIVLWTQVISGLELDDKGVIRGLDVEAWRERRRKLDELGGPPTN